MERIPRVNILIRKIFNKQNLIYSNKKRSENSWIPEKYLNCPRLLMKYERKAEREHEEINAKRIKLS